MSALRDLAVFITRLDADSPQMTRPVRLLNLLRQKAVAAIAEDDTVRENSAQYRTGGTDTPSNPCLVYLKSVAPSPDVYLFALPSGADATMVVDALNALPPTP